MKLVQKLGLVRGALGRIFMPRGVAQGASSLSKDTGVLPQLFAFWLVTGTGFHMLLLSARDFSAFSSPTLGNGTNVCHEHERRKAE